jgi:hypothetical protein
MARPKKTVEVPGQEPAQLAEGVTGDSRADEQTVKQRVSDLLDDATLTERNTLLSSINAQGAAIVTRFEELGFTDLADQHLTDNLEFLQLVKKATSAAPAATGGHVTNEEGKPQPVAGKPVLTEHGWHVPG